MAKANLYQIFRAGFVRRWHTNPDLSHTCDRIDGHSGRVARIILALHPDPTMELLREALTHDDGESVIGDIKAPTKDANSALHDALEGYEYECAKGIWGDSIMRSELSEMDNAWLKFADRLDAYMWAAHHAPHALISDGWPEARVWLFGQAEKFGVTDNAGFRAAMDIDGPWRVTVMQAARVAL